MALFYAKNKKLRGASSSSPTRQPPALPHRHLNTPPNLLSLKQKSFCVQVWLRASVQCSWKTAAGSLPHNEEILLFLLWTSISTRESVLVFFRGGAVVFEGSLNCSIYKNALLCPKVVVGNWQKNQLTVSEGKTWPLNVSKMWYKGGSKTHRG